MFGLMNRTMLTIDLVGPFVLVVLASTGVPTVPALVIACIAAVTALVIEPALLTRPERPRGARRMLAR